MTDPAEPRPHRSLRRPTRVRTLLLVTGLLAFANAPLGALGASPSAAHCGRGWRISPSPSPDSSILYGVASFPQGTAWAVGDIHPVFKSSTLALHNDGSGWTQVQTPNPDPVSNRL